MGSNELQLNCKAIAEANKATAPLLEVHRKACVVMENARMDYTEAWQYAYANALKAPRNN
jgi:hypothetical protein